MPGRTSEGQPVVVTGGAGFIGSHLVDRLVAEGHPVLVIDDLSAGDATALSSEARLEILDIARDDLETVLRRFRPTVVHHLAAQSSVPRSIRDPIADLAINVGGTARVVAASRATSVHRLVFVSSGGAIYGETARAATEDTRPRPASYYGIHKLAAEGHVALSGLSYAIARPANVYGPRQRAGLEGAVVAAFVARAADGEPLEIHGDGRQTRDLVHVADAVAALLRLAELDASGTWNVATGRRTSVLELADLVERALGRPLGRRHGPFREGDVRDSVLSPARLRALGWRPSIRLAPGIEDLVTAAVAGRDAAGVSS